MIIEMLAYRASHVIGLFSWRCVVCDDISAHSGPVGIVTHLVHEHGIPAGRLKGDPEGVWLYPEKTKETQ